MKDGHLAINQLLCALHFNAVSISHHFFCFSICFRSMQVDGKDVKVLTFESLCKKPPKRRAQGLGMTCHPLICPSFICQMSY